MSETLILLLPLLVLAAVALFAFAGCAPFGANIPSEPYGPPAPTGPTTYEEAVGKTPGLIAYWRLDETHLAGQPYPPAHDSGGVNNCPSFTMNTLSPVHSAT